MRDGGFLILRAAEIDSLLTGRELEIIRIVRTAYETHKRGESSLPHSVFLRFPNDDRNRIIALPTYLGGEFDVAGIKWVSSFPKNLELGLDRASAAIILNSTRDGRPVALLEGSIISARRTAASATLAAQCLHAAEGAVRAGLIGCGIISFEIAKFLFAASPEISALVVHDLDAARASRFREKCEEAFSNVEVEIATDIREVLGTCTLISFATTAIKPHVFDISNCEPSSTILHISLRDLAPEVIISADNVVDDTDHVTRAQTSVHLAEQLTGNRDFIRCTLADILTGEARPRNGNVGPCIFSPFGLGVLDMAVSKLVYQLAIEQGLGSSIDSFLAGPWLDKK